MITRGVGLASGVALVLAAVTMPGPAGMASPAQGVTAASAPVAWVVNSSVRSADAVALTPDGKTAYVALNPASPIAGAR